MSKFDIFSSQYYLERKSKHILKEGAECIAHNYSTILFQVLSKNLLLNRKILDHSQLYSKECRSFLISKIAANPAQHVWRHQFIQYVTELAKRVLPSFTTPDLEEMAKLLWETYFSEDVPLCDNSVIERTILHFLSKPRTHEQNIAQFYSSMMQNAVMTRTDTCKDEEKISTTTIVWSIDERRLLSEVLSPVILDIPGICRALSVDYAYVCFSLIDEEFTGKEEVEISMVLKLLSFLFRLIESLPNDVLPIYREQSLYTIRKLQSHISTVTYNLPEYFSESIPENFNYQIFFKTPFNQMPQQKKKNSRVLPPYSLAFDLVDAQ